MEKHAERWPYYPPANDRVEPLSDINRPSGFVLLSEAVNIVGKAVFEDMWTGEELNARGFTNVDLEESSQRDGEPKTLWPPGIKPWQIKAGRQRWIVVTIQGTRVVDTEEAARSIWQQQKPKLMYMWRREIAARKRYDSVVFHLRGGLNTAVIPSWAHQMGVGGKVDIPPHVWDRDNIQSVFDLGDDINAWSNPNLIEFNKTVNISGVQPLVKGRVILLPSDIDFFSPTLQIPSPAPQKNDEMTMRGKNARTGEVQALNVKPLPDLPADTHTPPEWWPKGVETQNQWRMYWAEATSIRPDYLKWNVSSIAKKVAKKSLNEKTITLKVEKRAETIRGYLAKMRNRGGPPVK